MARRLALLVFAILLAVSLAVAALMTAHGRQLERQLQDRLDRSASLQRAVADERRERLGALRRLGVPEACAKGLLLPQSALAAATTEGAVSEAQRAKGEALSGVPSARRAHTELRLAQELQAMAEGWQVYLDGQTELWFETAVDPLTAREWLRRGDLGDLKDQPLAMWWHLGSLRLVGAELRAGGERDGSTTRPSRRYAEEAAELIRGSGKEQCLRDLRPQPDEVQAAAGR